MRSSSGEYVFTLKLASGTYMLALVPSHHNHAIGEQIDIRLQVVHMEAFRVCRMALVREGDFHRS